MIVNLRIGQPNDVLMKLSGEVPVFVGQERESMRLYNELREDIEAVMGKVMTTVEKLCANLEPSDDSLQNAMVALAKQYHFIELLYALDSDGIQRSNNIMMDRQLATHRGQDRSSRPYYQKAKESSGRVTTVPYVSTFTGMSCISSAIRLTDVNGVTQGYAVVDVNFDDLVEYLERSNSFSGSWAFLSMSTLVIVTVATILFIPHF